MVLFEFRITYDMEWTDRQYVIIKAGPSFRCTFACIPRVRSEFKLDVCLKVGDNDRSSTAR